MSKIKINKTSVETRLAIERRSAAMLPDRPTQAGLKPWDIRNALFSAIIADKGACIMGEIDRIVDEANAAIDAMRIKSGTLTVSTAHWKGTEPPRAACAMGGLYTAGCAVIFMPEDDETKEQAGLARISMAINETIDGEWSDVVVFVGEGGEIPSVDLHFRYVVIPTESETDAIVTLVGVDAYGEGGTTSGVDESAVRAIITAMLGNVANERQYSASNPPPYPVTSVNGKTGAVSLVIPSEAADVKAEEAGAVSNHNADQTAHPYLSGRVATALDRISGHDTNIEEINTSVAERLKTADLAAKLDAYKAAQGLVSNTTSNLTNYYLKSEIYTKEEVAALISAIPKFEIKVVTSLPTSNISLTTVYLVKDTTEGGGLYTEYIYVNGAWEELGSQTVDLSGYITDEELDNLLKNYATLTKVSELIADALKPYATEEEITEAIRVATVNFVTGAQVTIAINNALNAYYTSAQVDAEIAAQIKTALTPYILKEDADKTYQPKGDYAEEGHDHDGTYAKPSDIPTVPSSLPNPYALTILGKTYNGSSAVALTVEEIIEAIKTASGGVAAYLDGNKLVLSGNLPDATYTAYYEVENDDGTKSLVEIGELTLGEEETTEPDPVTYTVTFVADGETVATVTYEAGTTSIEEIEEPTVPAKDGYTGVWESYTLKDTNITVNAVYTAIEAEPAGPTNLLTAAIDTDGSIYNGVGYLTGYRLGGGANGAMSGYTVTGYMPAGDGTSFVIRTSNKYGVSSSAYSRVALYDANFTFITGAEIQLVANSLTTAGYTYETGDQGGFTMIDLTSWRKNYSNATYWRMSTASTCIDSSTVITLNEEIE